MMLSNFSYMSHFLSFTAQGNVMKKFKILHLRSLKQEQTQHEQQKVEKGA